MTDDAHVHTEQETVIYDALTAGEHETIDTLREDAIAAGDTELEQFTVDYTNAYAHYQADHEAPERAREGATLAAVEDENTEASRG